jgi:hypothetical protein
VDTLIIEGADVVSGLENVTRPKDLFLLRKLFVALINDFDNSGSASPDDKVERVNYDENINARLIVRGLGGDDKFIVMMLVPSRRWTAAMALITRLASINTPRIMSMDSTPTPFIAAGDRFKPLPSSSVLSGQRRSHHFRSQHSNADAADRRPDRVRRQAEPKAEV